MNSASLIFFLLVMLFLFGNVLFFCWWIRDIYRTTIAIEAARNRLERIGISSERKLTTKQISNELRKAIDALSSNSNDHDIFLLFASLYLLRRELGLSCRFFALELKVLPGTVLKRLLDNSERHIVQQDVNRFLPYMPSPRIASRIAERFEENICDLGIEMKSKALIDNNLN